MARGFGYETASADAWLACLSATRAGAGLGLGAETKERMRGLAAQGTSFAADVLGPELGLPR